MSTPDTATIIGRAVEASTEQAEQATEWLLYYLPPDGKGGKTQIGIAYGIISARRLAQTHADALEANIYIVSNDSLMTSDTISPRVTK